MTENSFEIDIGKPEVMEFDYSLSALELEAFVAEKYSLIKKGKKDLVNREFSMLYDAFCYLDYCRSVLGIQLDMTEGCLEALEQSLDKIVEKMAAGSMAEEEFKQLINLATAYLGVTIIKNIGGAWVPTNAGIAVMVGGNTIFVNNRMARRMLNGKEDEIVGYYWGVKETCMKQK
ncbi:MAG: hypothetical protein K2I10_11860 [Lachnospiraceae bacterium]|nr:hypothetical protein [Lachnospiraceae bacterium]